ncbi:MAG: RING finger protein [Thermoguttaceae bacterium]
MTFLRVIQTPIQKGSPRSSPTTYFSDSSYGPLPLAAIMSQVITCQCGAKVRLPEETANRAFRCPKCKNGIALTLDAKVLRSAPLKPGAAGATCPICQSGIALAEPVVTCPQCDQIHHGECWAEIGGCGTYGCKQAPALEKGAATSQPLTAWGDTKKCPVCGETIKSIALRCRYCQTDFDTAQPISLRDIERREKKKETQKGWRTKIIVLFAMSLLLGCLAPLMAIINCILFLPKRREVADAGPAYVVLAYAAIIVSVIYSILMAFFIAFGGMR